MPRPRITFYGGARQLGGNQILVEDQGTRVFLDFGSNFDRMGRYYSFPFSPKKFNALKELTVLGIYPDFDAYPGFDGLYRPDYLRRIGREPAAKSIDGVVFSHAHLDHAAGLHFLRPDMDVYMDRYTKMLLYSMQETSNAPFNEFIDFTYAFEQAPKLREDGYTWLQGDVATVSRKINIIRPPEPFNIGNIKFEPFYVDHSLPGSCAFIIHTSAGIVAYTGDIRLRGRRKSDTENFIREAAARKPDYLLCEGSLIRKTHPGVEDDVVTHIADFVQDRTGLVVIIYPPRDLDRVTSLYKVAKQTGRKLVVDARQTFLLDLFDGELGYPKTTHKHIGVYMPRKNKGILDTEYPNQERDYQKWERAYIEHPNRVTTEDMKRNPNLYILCLSSSRVGDLVDIDPPEGSVYVRSHPEPYTEEMEIDEKILINWLEKFRLLRQGEQKDLFDTGAEYNIPQAHITGHMSFDDTRYLINGICPRFLCQYTLFIPKIFITCLAVK